MEREVRIGDRTVRLESLSSFKVVRGGKALSRITRQVSGLDKQIQEFVASFRAANEEKVTRAVFEYRQGLEEAARIAAHREQVAAEHPEWDAREVEADLEAFKAALALGRLEISAEAWEKSGNEVTLSRDPSPMQIGAFLLPQILDSAEEEVTKLLALIASPDNELRQAKSESRYEEYLDERAETLLFDAEIEQLLELAAVAGEVLTEKLQGKAQRLRTAWGRLTGAKPQTPATETDETSGEPSSSTSSTDSPPPTDGEPTRPSSPTGTPQPASSSA
jgi:hypothetical protein